MKTNEEGCIEEKKLITDLNLKVRKLEHQYQDIVTQLCDMVVCTHTNAMKLCPDKCMQGNQHIHPFYPF